MHPYIWVTEVLWPWAQIHWIWDIVIVILSYFALTIFGELAGDIGEFLFDCLEGILEFFLDNEDGVVGFAKLALVAAIGFFIYFLWSHR